MERFKRGVFGVVFYIVLLCLAYLWFGRAVPRLWNHGSSGAFQMMGGFSFLAVILLGYTLTLWNDFFGKKRS